MRIQLIITAFFYLATANAQKSTPGIPVDSNVISRTSSKSIVKRPETSSKPSKKEIARIRAANIKQAAKIQFTYFIIRGESNSYGYSIYADGNLYIQQNTLPGIAGTKGFSDTTSAAKTARLVIRKMKQGEIPPTISIDDLKKIGVLK